MFAQKLSYIASALVSILACEVIVLLVFAILPLPVGAWFPAFTYYGELVEVSPLGFLLPIILSVCLLFVSRPSAVTGKRTRGFRGRNLWLVVAIFALASTLIFVLTQNLYGSVEIPVSWAIWIVPVGAITGSLYGMVNGRRSSVLEGFANCYVVGALGLVLSDMIRTLARLTVAQEIVWGGEGLHDLVFWFGIYIGMGWVVFRLVCPKLIGLFSDALARKQD
jgi:hypothetical protein